MVALRDSPIRVLIVDDHTMFAETLTMAINTLADVEVVGQAHSLAEAHQFLEEQTVDLVILDYRLPDSVGSDGITSLRRAFPEAACLVLTAVSDPRIAAEVISAGAIGYLTKDLDLAALSRGIRDSVRGRPVVDSDMTRAMLARLSRGDHQLGQDLTKREQQILEMMAQGLSAAQMATVLHLSVSTVRNHVAKILAKFNVHSMREAVALARNVGILADHS
ncbi:MAG: response regulator [Acidimicrobiales bacterium]